ncbi:MAG: ABC transporter ATP-binding protein [Acidimicrobiales bacterium]
MIRTEALAKTYPGGVTAVHGLDLEVEPGEIFGLLGPNGAGKTTTAGMLTTRVLPTGGRALVDGLDVTANASQVKARIGVVTQTNTLDRALNVRENLEYHGRFFAMSKKAARTAADELLERFRLADRAQTPVLALSGGLAQRLMLARAVMHRPSVLFLDEPTTGLDPQSRIALWEVLRELHAEGQTVLLTTHYMEEADQLCQRVGIIDEGRLIALGTPGELKSSVGVDTVVTVTADGDQARFAAALLAGVPGATTAEPVDGSIRLGVAGTHRVVPAIVEIIGELAMTLTDISVREPTLETVFITLTGKDLRE